MTIHVVKQEVPADLMHASSDIANGIMIGEIVGLGVIAMLRSQRFFVDSYGEVRRNPHLARGLLLSLDDHLRALLQDRADTSSTV